MSFEDRVPPQEFNESEVKANAQIAAERLMLESKFKRSTSDTGEVSIEMGERKFTIHSIEHGEHPDIEQVQALFVKTFGEEECDPEEVLRQAIDGKTPWEGVEGDVKYRIHVIKDEEGKVVSTVAGGVLDLLDAEQKPTGKQMYMVGYMVTDSDARQGGLAREAYISAILDAANISSHEGKDLAFAAGECTSTSEKYWNSVGWKRAYVGENPGDTKTYKELEYVQPALDFNETTGEVAEDAGVAAEHFMVDGFSRHTPTKEEVMQTVEAFYKWCNKWPRQAFDTDKAYEKHVEHVREIEDQFKKQLTESGQLIFLDKDSREKAREANVSVKDYTEADHVDMDEENF